MSENTTKETVKGFKVFNSDWVCRDKEYTCPGRFKKEGELEVCGHGMHFCLDASDCFRYYDYNMDNRVAEVIAHGNVVYGDDKCCTDDLEIVREISWEEVQKIVNVGKYCTGIGNTGNGNTGDWNTGDWNTGSRNTGNGNTSSFNTGCFNTEERSIFLFNKSSDWSYRDWLNSQARCLLNQIQKNVVEWIYSDDMTDEEKSAYPTHETTGGYLKVLDESECGQIWWDGLSEEQKEVIRSIPNYNKEIFERITGIRTE